VCVVCFVTISLGQLITMAGLDKTSMPLSAKPPGSSEEYINGQSRIDATQQMRAILENSHLDESILSSDLQPVCNGRPVSFTTKPAGDPTQQNSRDQASVSRNGPRSKFDELYQQALRNAESILSDSGNPPDGHVVLQNLHSPVRSDDQVPCGNDSQLETSSVQFGLHPVNKCLSSGQNGQLPASNDKLSDSHLLQDSQQSGTQHPSASGRSQDADKSVDSGRVDETEISEEYTTEEDDIEEIRLHSQ